MPIRIQASANQRMVSPGVENTKGTYNPAAQEAQARGFAQLGQGIDQVRVAFEKKRQEDETKNSLEATNAFQRGMSELFNEMTQKRRLGNAEGVAAEFAQKTQALKDEVFTNSKIKYKDTQEQFYLQAERISIAMEDGMQKFETSETDKNFVLQIDESIENMVTTFSAAGNIEDVASGIAGLENSIEKAGVRFGDDWTNSKKREALTRLVKAAAKSKIINENDYNGAEAVLDKFTGKVSEEELLQIRGAIRQTAEQNAIMQDAAKFAGRNMTPEQIQEALAREGEGLDHSDFDASKFYKAGNARIDNLTSVAKAGVVALDSLVKSMGGPGLYITSGTDGSHAGGEHSHANGWKIDFGTTGPGQADWLDKKENRDKLVAAGAKVGMKISDEWEDTGDPNWSGPHMDVSFAGYNLAQKAGAKRGQAINKDTAYAMKVYAMSNQLNAINENQIKAANQKIFDEADQKMYELYQSGVKDTNAYLQIAKEYSPLDNPALARNLLARAAQWGESLAKGANSKTHPRTVLDIEKEIDLGRYKSEDELWATMAQAGVDMPSQKHLGEYFRKAGKKEGVDSVDWARLVPAAAKMSGLLTNAPNYKYIESGIHKTMKEAAVNHYKETGKVLDESTLLNIGKEAAAKEVIALDDSFFFGEKIEVSAAEKAQAGIKDIASNGDGTARVTYMDGTIENMTVASLERRLGR